MVKHRCAVLCSLLAAVAATALPATVQGPRDKGEDCDRGEENCVRGQGPPPRVATIYPVARFDCYYFDPRGFDPRGGGPDYVAALNRAFALPSGEPNPHVGLWRCRRVGQPDEICFSAGGAPLDLARAGIQPGRLVLLLFEVEGDCAEFVIQPSSSVRVTRPAPGRWHVEPRESGTLSFEIRIRAQDPSDHWSSFFDVRLPS